MTLSVDAKIDLWYRVMLSFHCSTPIPRPMSVPISMAKMGTVAIGIRIGLSVGSVETALHIAIVAISIGVGIGIGQWKHTITYFYKNAFQYNAYHPLR